MERKIYAVYGRDIAAMTASLLERAGIAGKMPQHGLIALKPNLVVAKPESSGATTHREILEALIRFIQANSSAKITIMEGAWVGASTVEGFRACGYDKLAEKYGVGLLDLKRDSTVEMDTAIGKMRICRSPMEADWLITLPVLKGHCQTVMTCALKNCKGCLPDAEKRRFHAMGLQRPIAALAAVLKPDLAVVDSICGDLDFEEGGTPVETDRMLLGDDMVQIDAYGCRLLGIPLSDVPYIGLAEKFGAGSASVRDGDVIELNKPAAAPSAHIGGRVRKLTAGVVQDSACSACFGNLVRALYQLDRNGRPYTGQISIGQGFKGKSIPGVGIGSCCSGAGTCVPGCPAQAEDIIKALENAPGRRSR